MNSSAGQFVDRLAAKPKRSRIVRVLIVGAVLSCVLLYMASRSVSWDAVWQQISGVSLPILALTLVTKFTSLLLGALRTQALIRNQHPFRLRVLFDSHLAGFSANNLLPLRFGDLLRIDYMAKRGGLAHGTCLQVVVIERLFDVLSLVVITAVLLPFVSVAFPVNSAFYVGSLVAMGGALAIFVAKQRPTWFVRMFSIVARLGGERVGGILVAKCEAFVKDLATVSTAKNTTLAFGYSLAIWGVAMITVQIWLRAFGITLAWYSSLLVQIFLAFGVALPATPGQIGTYHYFVTAALGASGLDKVHALSVAVVAHAMSIIPFTIIGLPSLIAFVVKRAALAVPSTPAGGGTV